MKYGVPSMAKIIAKRMPVETNHYLGKEAIEILDKFAFEPSELSMSRQQELANLFQVYADNYPEHQISFKFRKSKGKRKEEEKGVGANAFTLPNGTIVFTDEMVNLAANDHELVAILGHEIGHVVHRHILRRIIQNSSTSILIIFITGDVSAASSLVLALPSLLFNLSYSRDFENEADDFAYNFLIKNNLDPDSFAQIMQRLKYYNSSKLNYNDSDAGMSPKKTTPDTNEDEGRLLKQITPYLSTHPDTENRIRKFMNKKKDLQKISKRTCLLPEREMATV
jgi:Zn-dependent protease with chaperone function